MLGPVAGLRGAPWHTACANARGEGAHLARRGVRPGRCYRPSRGRPGHHGGQPRHERGQAAGRPAALRVHHLGSARCREPGPDPGPRRGRGRGQAAVPDRRGRGPADLPRRAPVVRLVGGQAADPRYRRRVHGDRVRPGRRARVLGIAPAWRGTTDPGLPAGRPARPRPARGFARARKGDAARSGRPAALGWRARPGDRHLQDLQAAGPPFRLTRPAGGTLRPPLGDRRRPGRARSRNWPGCAPGSERGFRGCRGRAAGRSWPELSSPGPR